MEWLNYHHLYYFWVVAKEGSFTRASEKLRIAQSAVSLQVSQLEDFLGKRLIERNTSRKMTLTEEGRLVFVQAEEIFRQGRELVEEVKSGESQKSIRVGAFGSLSKNLQIRLLGPLLKKEDIELNVDVGDPQRLLDRLTSFHLDLILCDVPYPFSEDIPLIQREIAKEPFCFAGRKLRMSQSLQERLVHEGVFLPARSHIATTELEHFISRSKEPIKIRGYIDDIALLRLLALETEALVAIPKIGVERDLKSRSLSLFHEFRSLYQRFYLVLRQTGSKSQMLLKLLDQDQ